MKISVEDGIVVCSLDNKVEGFLSIRGAYGCFKGFYKGKLRIHVPFADEKDEIRVINNILVAACDYKVEVDDSVYERLKALEAILEAERKRKEAEYAEAQKQKLWQEKCEKGCGKCPYRKRGYEDNYCTASGKLELLDEKNVPGYVDGIHYLFKYEPFPSENCIYKIN